MQIIAYNPPGCHAHIARATCASLVPIEKQVTDPNPIKHPAVLLAKIRDQIEPRLAARGFRAESRSDRHETTPIWIDYRSGDQLFSLRWDAIHAMLTADMLGRDGNVARVAQASTNLVMSQSELLARVEPFVRATIAFLDRLSSVHDGGC